MSNNSELEIKTYYNKLAQNYDNNRFNNSYGQYLDQQERDFLNQALKSISPERCMDLGCGTGRLLEYADYGVDFSPEMLKVAKTKYPNKVLLEGRLTDIPIANHSLDAIYSFHVIMHQDHATTIQFLNEAHQKLKSKGKLIFDFPSAKRRQAVKHQQSNWHAAHQMTLSEIEKIAGTQWKIIACQGFLFFPIHRIPIRFRPLFKTLDNLLCRSFLKQYASYLAVVLEKQSSLSSDH
ncbi:class I SAM-dependent methyltransferase [Acinetobacter nematophilus]|uniref:class I SAM-dependent methyltransferase n=1 Tax=Acinetobacter TaxID=469 RepID=UPI0033405115